MTAYVKLKVSDQLFLRDPEETELGRKIVGHSVLLMNQIGFEGFTFKKLAAAIDSTEASIYRYFSNKHQLLNYLRGWYWSWLSYRVSIGTMNIQEPWQRLQITLKVLAESGTDDPATAHIDEAALHKLIIAESAKAHVTELEKGSSGNKITANFEGLYNFSGEVAQLIKEISPNYPQPRALALLLIITAHRLIFYADHCPKMTEIKGKRKDNREVTVFLEGIVEALLA